MLQGIRLGIDVGKVRIGLASSDSDGMIATPIATINRSAESIDSAVAEIVSQIKLLKPITIYVGLPLALSGNMTASTRDALEFAKALSERTAAGVFLIDERLTTVSAHQALRNSGKKQKQSKNLIDQVAAVMILQHALETERSLGKVAGKPVGDFPDVA